MKEYIMRETEEQTTFGSVWRRYEPVRELIRCRDCKWYAERISMCDNCGLPREQTFFCADGRRKGGEVE